MWTSFLLLLRLSISHARLEFRIVFGEANPNLGYPMSNYYFLFVCVHVPMYRVDIIISANRYYYVILAFDSTLRRVHTIINHII